MKIKLALDGARSLQFLHGFDPPYIHRDVKVRVRVGVCSERIGAHVASQ
jgi:hypothetical protein